MQTITLRDSNGKAHEMPVEGLDECPDFEIDRRLLQFILPTGRRQAINRLSPSYSSPYRVRYIRHAACVAAKWYEHLAEENLNSDSWGGIVYWRSLAAARAWGELIDWSE